MGSIAIELGLGFQAAPACKSGRGSLTSLLSSGMLAEVAP